MADSGVPSAEMSSFSAGQEDSSEAYGTFVHGGARGIAPIANVPSATEANADLAEPVSFMSDNDGEDEWAKIRSEYSTQSTGLLGSIQGWAKRIPAHMVVILVALFTVAVVTIFIIEGSGSSAPKPRVTPALAHPAPAAPKKMPPLNQQQQAEVKKLAQQQAASLAAQALAAEQQAAAKKAAQEAAVAKAKEEKEEAKRAAELKQILTIQPTDSPAVRQSINQAQMRQNAVTYNQQRLNVAQENLQPLEQWVGQKQAAYNAEEQQYVSWKNKLAGDEAILNDVMHSKQAIAQRLAQLKVLGRRESMSVPHLEHNMLIDEKKQELALESSQHFAALATQAKQQLAETQRAEADDSQAVGREKAMMTTQQSQAKDEMAQSQKLLTKTSGIEKTIAQLSPIVSDLQAAYLHEQRSAIQKGLVKQDQQRETARDTLNNFIRQRERIQQLPKSKKHAAELKKISAELKAAQKKLGTLYSNEESDKEQLESSVKAKEQTSALYIRFKHKNALLAKAKARLNALSTRSDEIRLQAQASVNAAAAAEQRASSTQSTNALLANAERRLRVKEKVFSKESRVQAADAQRWAEKAKLMQKRQKEAKAELSQQTMRGEEYLENAMSGQQKRKSLQMQVSNEQQAFNQEKMLLEGDAQQLQAAQTNLAAAEAVLRNLNQQQTLAKAQAWEADMAVKEARRNQQLQAEAQAGSATLPAASPSSSSSSPLTSSSSTSTAPSAKAAAAPAVSASSSASAASASINQQYADAQDKAIDEAVAKQMQAHPTGPTHPVKA